jgi:MoaA/NifB/PqqE/SkfB family radical SAM enzyme
VKLLNRIAKHARINWENLSIPDAPSPPFVILFINSICNMKCEHCFYWQSLNSPDDLTFDEIVGISKQLGHIENLNLSGGDMPTIHSGKRGEGNLRTDKRLLH